MKRTVEQQDEETLQVVIQKKGNATSGEAESWENPGAAGDLGN